MTQSFAITFELAGYWCIANGRGTGAHLDRVVLKDEQSGLPYIPGKSVKGLLRDAYQQVYTLYQNHDGIELDQPNYLFGEEGYNRQRMSAIGETEPGIIHVSNAVLSDAYAQVIASHSSVLYRALYSTAINDMGVAKDKSLRTVEVTVPLPLFAEVTLHCEDALKKDTLDYLNHALRLIRHLGAGRNRGLGRVRVQKAAEAAQ